MTKAEIVEQIYEQVGFFKKGSGRTRRDCLRDYQGHTGEWREGQDLGVWELRRARQECAQGA